MLTGDLPSDTVLEEQVHWGSRGVGTVLKVNDADNQDQDETSRDKLPFTT